MPAGVTRKLLDTVVANGFCIGCGACSAVAGSPLTIKLNDDGQYEAAARADVDADDLAEFEQVCPFSETARDEDEIGRALYQDCAGHNPNTGYFRSLYAGHVVEGDYRTRGSSGGFGTWIAAELIREKRVDFVIHVSDRFSEPCESGSASALFGYRISATIEGVSGGAKSRYYPVHMADVLRTVRERPGRYAIVGLPCFIKAVRLLQQSEPIFAERIRFCIGLVCGHLKSAMFADSLAWQSGFAPGTLRSIDFRSKDPGAAADHYRVCMSNGSKQVNLPARDFFGSDWGAGAFKYKACDFCDDVFAETADVVVGDAWLPEFVGDPLGNNIVLVRNAELDQLISEAAKQSRIAITPLTVAEIAASQAGGLRHRRDAISYRLAKEKQAQRWVPQKRVKPALAIFPKNERQRQDLRAEFRSASAKAFREARSSGDYDLYVKQMMPIYEKYRAIGGSFIQRVASLLRRTARHIP